MGFSRKEHWSGLPFPSPEDLPYPGIEPGSPALQVDSLPTEPPGKPQYAAAAAKSPKQIRRGKGPAGQEVYVQVSENPAAEAQEQRMETSLEHSLLPGGRRCIPLLLSIRGKSTMCRALWTPPQPRAVDCHPHAHVELRGSDGCRPLFKVTQATLVPRSFPPSHALEPWCCPQHTWCWARGPQRPLLSAGCCLEALPLCWDLGNQPPQYGKLWEEWNPSSHWSFGVCN